MRPRSSHFLDVGCGIGRLAIAMPDFLDANGSYEGFDIVPEGIEWCKQHIAGPYDNIHFTLADIYNKEYNPKGSKQPADYQFPYEDETFDVAVLLSVFTHMLPIDVDRYVGEIARVLKKDGRICASYYVITAGIAPDDDFRSRLYAFQAQPRVTLDPKQERPRTRRRL